MFNFVLSRATGLLFGLVPALRSTKPSLAPTLKDTVGAVIGGGGVRRGSRALEHRPFDVHSLVLINSQAVRDLITFPR